MTAVIEKQYQETVPGLMNRVMRHTKGVLDRKNRNYPTGVKPDIPANYLVRVIMVGDGITKHYGRFSEGISIEQVVCNEVSDLADLLGIEPTQDRELIDGKLRITVSVKEA